MGCTEGNPTCKFDPTNLRVSNHMAKAPSTWKIPMLQLHILGILWQAHAFMLENCTEYLCEICFTYCLRFWSGLVFYKVHCDSAVKGRVKTILRCIAKHCGHNTKELNTSNSQSKTNPSFRTLKTVCIILMAYRGSN